MLQVTDLEDIIKSRGLELHFYANDGQIHSSSIPPNANQLWIQAIEWITSIKPPDAESCKNPVPMTEYAWKETSDQSCIFHVGRRGHQPHESEQISSVGSKSSVATFQQLSLFTRAFVLLRIDYCNSVLLGLLDIQSSSLKSVMNVSVCLIFTPEILSFTDFEFLNALPSFERLPLSWLHFFARL